MKLIAKLVIFLLITYSVDGSQQLSQIFVTATVGHVSEIKGKQVVDNLMNPVHNQVYRLSMNTVHNFIIFSGRYAYLIASNLTQKPDLLLIVDNH